MSLRLDLRARYMIQRIHPLHMLARVFTHGHTSSSEQVRMRDP